MFYYYFVLAIQVFCIYHAYKNRKETFWYFVIFFIPLIGSIFYIFTQVINSGDVEKVSEELNKVINPTKKVKDLEKQLKFANTFQNRVNLADAYMEIGDYENANIHYEAALQGNFKNDYYVIKQMIGAMSRSKQYSEVILLAEKIKDKTEFKNSKTQFIYGLALDKLGRIQEAEENMKTIDQRYSNYEERYILAEFYMTNNKKDKAREVLQEMITESEHMSKDNKRKYRSVMQMTRQLFDML